MQAINLKDKLAKFDDVFAPRVVAALNGQLVKVVKVEGAFPWHAHADEDELFLVVDGEMDLEFRDRVVHLGPGELCVVPRGVEHRPVAKVKASVVLFEPATVRNTGEVDDAHTVEAEDLEWI